MTRQELDQNKKILTQELLAIGRSGMVEFIHDIEAGGTSKQDVAVTTGSREAPSIIAFGLSGSPVRLSKTWALILSPKVLETVSLSSVFFMTCAT